jgi:hypothetical protein
MKRMTALFIWLLPSMAAADPLDTGEAYTMRKGPPEWMDGVGFTWLLVDYALFAAVVALIGWLLMRRPELFARFEKGIRWPFAGLLGLASRFPAGLRELLQVTTYLSVLLLVVGWVMFCQWLNHIHLGAVAMAGLALLAVILVRTIRRSEEKQTV